MEEIVLYSYCKSSCSYRVRIALNLKSINYKLHTINLLPGIDENWQEKYLKINPQGLVPALAVNDQLITQSSAIIEYLEETYPQHALLPRNALERAYTRSLVQLINCDIQPLNNLRVLEYLKSDMQCNKKQIEQWYCHWISQGLLAFEKLLTTNPYAGDFCTGEHAGLADTCLIPQLYNARRFNCDLSSLQKILSIEKKCLELDSFIHAAPEQQIDYNG